MYHLLKAVRLGSRLILVGDVDQLPSVGPGNVLKDILNSEVVPTVRLTEIFRQAGESHIVVNAHRINRGLVPLINDKDKDFFLIEEDDPDKAAALVVDLVKNRLPSHIGCDSYDDIQVLTPMRRYAVGVENLNKELQSALNPREPLKLELESGDTVFRFGDKVMQIRNDYQKGVFNGDIGRVTAIDPEDGMLVVTYQGPDGEREVFYERAELDELVLSYAVTVHKSQGSEYPVVVLPLLTQHYVMLQRNLFYTAVTRAKRFVVLVGSRRAVSIAVRNNRIEKRYTGLAYRLRRCQSKQQ
jgi:exodeoxyribonuclease V alpha subunit